MHLLLFAMLKWIFFSWETTVQRSKTDADLMNMTLWNCTSLVLVLPNQNGFTQPFHKCSFFYLSRWFERERRVHAGGADKPQPLSAHIAHVAGTVSGSVARNHRITPSFQLGQTLLSLCNWFVSVFTHVLLLRCWSPAHPQTALSADPEVLLMLLYLKYCYC